jgi:hypothetical protein
MCLKNKNETLLMIEFKKHLSPNLAKVRMGGYRQRVCDPNVLCSRLQFSMDLNVKCYFA